MNNNDNRYKENVTVSPELDESLKKCFLNHLVLYNYTLDVLDKTPDIHFKNLKKMIYDYIVEKNITIFIGSSLYNELYYLMKKYKNNNKSHKQLSSIQYLTFYINNYDNKNFTVEGDKIFFKDFKGHITIDKPLPPIENNELIYLNISFSTNENQYQISVFK
jgi:hypothetical protein